MVGRQVHQYQLLEKLGSGGMGDIYKAQDHRLNRFVGVKVLTAAATGDPERRRRFIQEAQAASALNHPNIITIHDIISEGDTEFMVMEYVAGRTLVDLIPKGGLRVPQVLKYSVQMADALQAAHNAGIVHRDLKPGNVMVTEAGLVKVLDFGLAKLTDRGPISTVSGPDDATQTIAQAPLTVEGSIIGTVSYMSPEQAQGKKVDTRSDIFSFGVVLYEMVTGARAFAGESALSTLSAILRDDVRPIAETSPEVPPQLEMVIARCLKKLPDDRWQTMKDVQMALGALKHESDSGMLYRSRMSEIQPPAAVAAVSASAAKVSAPPAGTAPAPAPAPAKKVSVPVLASVVGGVFFIAAIAGGGVWWFKHRNPAEPPPVAVVTPEPAPAPALTEPPPAEATALPAPAPDATLTNENIIEMWQAKVSPNVIMSQIRASAKTNFILTPAELIRLTKAGVPDTVIEQMRNPKRVASVLPTPTPAAPAKGPSPAPAPLQPAPQQPAPQQQAAPQPPPTTPQTSQTPPAPKAVTTTPVSVKDGTPFGILLSEAVPDKAEEGRPLVFTAKDDLKVGDNVVIPKGATVTGAIAEVPGKKILGAFGGGKMMLKLIDATAADGHKLNVRGLQARRAEGTLRQVEPQGKAKVKDVTAPAGTEYIAYIDGDQTVAVRKVSSLVNAHLFDALTIRGVTFPNRIAVSPMCEFSSVDGYATDWHLVHLGSRAVGGASVVFTEATAVTPDGRISPVDLGIWKDGHIEMLARITRFLASQGCLAGIQLAHAGRKGSTAAPWDGMGPVGPSNGGWIPSGPSPVPFSEKHAVPREMTEDDIRGVVQAFGDGARRALDAGFQVAEIHAAHGYLLQQFLSPLSNRRTDRYGGSFDNRIRMLCEVSAHVRTVWPDRLPLFVRISATDWDDAGWTVDDSVELARRLAPLGVDLIDCSSGGNIPQPNIPFGSGYQTSMADRIRRESGVMTGAVGSITSAAQAEHIVFTGQADMVLIAREMLRDPYFPLRAARELEQKIAWPKQYSRSAPKDSPRREPLPKHLATNERD